MIHMNNFWKAVVVLSALFWCFHGVFALEVTPQMMKQLQGLQGASAQMGNRAAGSQNQELGADWSVEEDFSRSAAFLPGNPTDTKSATPDIPRIFGGETILLRFSARPDEAGLEAKAMTKRDVRIPDRTLFVLDNGGGLTLGNVGRIPLAGLSEREAAERIEAEPAFAGLAVTFKILPLEQEVKPFGYDLFSGKQEALRAVTGVPVPDNYVLGPGDTVLVQLFGKENVEYELPVTRNGMLLLPSIGPVPVSGLTFSQLQREIRNRIATQLIGVKASVTLGKLRSIRVFAMGDVEQPGSYVISGLSNMTNALFASGGVKTIGSLRNIQLKRDGKTIARLDLYDLLLKGDMRSNVRLLPGDVIFIPPVGQTVTVDGQVRRPAIYELKGERTVAELVEMAGGYAPGALLQEASIERFSSSGARIMVAIDLSQPGGREMPVRDGDIISIPSVSGQLENIVSLYGHVQRPGIRQWFKGMRMTDLIGGMRALLPGADSRYVLIKRENPHDRGIELLATDLNEALLGKGAADKLLQPRDEVYVFDIHDDRSKVIDPLLDTMRYQARPGSLYKEATVSGMVHHPGRYPVSAEMRVSTLLKAAGGLTDSAYTLKAELTRFVVEQGERRVQQRMEIDISAVIQGDEHSDIAVRPYDQIVVRRIPDWTDQGRFEISGEVRFPGTYPIERGEKLSDLLRRAGGLTEDAYPKGAVFVRESIRLREQEQINRLASRLEQDLATISVEGRDIGKDKDKALMEGEVLLGQMRKARALGRMVIRLDAILENREAFDITLQPGDKLFIPHQYEDVIVMGEVYHPTSHLYHSKFDVNDYIRLSGGVNEKGNKRMIYVVHVDGSVVQSKKARIGPGDVIVVPFKLDRISSHQLMVDVSQVLYQLAITAASLKVLDVF